MSKYVKNLITDHLRHRLQNVHDALLVNVVGLDANTNHRLRNELASKNIHLVVVKNSLAARAMQGTPLAAAVRRRGRHGGHLLGQRRHRQPGQGNHQADQERQVQAAGGPRRRDGRRAAHRRRRWQQVSKWPSRSEQLSMLLGQILSPGAQLASQLTSVGGALASQIEQKGEESEEEAEEKPPQKPSEAASRERRPSERTATKEECRSVQTNLHDLSDESATDCFARPTTLSARKDRIVMATAEATRTFSPLTQELGEKIVGLTLKEAKELSDYLEEVHGIKPAAGGAVMMAAPATAAAPPRPRPRRPSSTWSWKATATEEDRRDQGGPRGHVAWA